MRSKGGRRGSGSTVIININTHGQITLIKQHPETAVQWSGYQTMGQSYKNFTELLQTDLFDL